MLAVVSAISDQQELELKVPAKSFVKEYEHALGTQDWNSVAPLISDDAIAIFSNGSLHAGKEAIRAAYQRNFNTIKGEEYRIENVRWLADTADAAAYSFEFHWTGVIDGREASGSGRGTTVLVRRNDRWLLVGEQLGPKS
ncbi:MAG: nuclear transport factor 2 family protein [Pseudomonadota bacterium]